MLGAPWFKTFLHLVGGCLALVGLLFVGWQLLTLRDQIALDRLNQQVWLILVALSLVMAIANLALALAWWHLLRLRDLQVGARWAITTYGLAQLAKYVPGNIAHLAGRQALGMAAGIPGWFLAKVMVWELVMQAACGSLFALLALPLLLTAWPLWLAILTAALLAALPSLLWACRLSILGRNLPLRLVAAWHWQLVYMAVAAGIFLLVLMAISASPPSAAASLPIAGAFVAAWLIGFVTPGAPAGVGVRELVLLKLLEDILPQHELLLAVVLSRLVTVVADLLFFAVASLLATRSSRHEKS